MKAKSNQTPNISSAELEVLQVLWEAERPLKIREVCDRLQKSNWTYNTVGTFLQRLEEKGAVTAAAEGRAKFYTPIIDRESYTQEQTKTLISRLYNGSVKDLAVSLFRSEDMTDDDIEEIRKMFNL